MTGELIRVSIVIILQVQKAVTSEQRLPVNRLMEVNYSVDTRSSQYVEQIQPAFVVYCLL
jgi:hypothetical protein